MNEHNGAFNPDMYEPENKETVILIASGYEWTCPDCDHLNNEPEIYNEVTCDNCDTSYKVDQDGIYHAYH